MATTSNLRTTVGSVLGTVTTVAQSVGSVFDAASGGIGMLNTYVQTASEKQAIGIDYEMADYEQDVLTRVSAQRTRQNREIKNFLDEHPGNAEEFEKVFTDLQEKVAARREARTKNRQTSTGF